MGTKAATRRLAVQHEARNTATSDRLWAEVVSARTAGTIDDQVRALHGYIGHMAGDPGCTLDGRAS